MLLGSLWQTLVAPLQLALLAALCFAPLEQLFALHRQARSERSTDLWFATFGQLLVELMLALALGYALACVDQLALDQALSATLVTERWQTAFEVACGLLTFELMGYAYHRLAHRVPWLWRLHAVHHSSTSMDWLAAFRQHPLEILLMTFVQNAPLVLLGIPLASHAWVVLLLRLNTIFVHANLRTPRQLSWLLATPAFHHRHHQCEGASRNFATLFPWLDRVFGTFSADTAHSFGLPKPIAHSFLGLMLHPFQRGAAPERAVVPQRPATYAERAYYRRGHGRDQAGPRANCVDHRGLDGHRRGPGRVLCTGRLRLDRNRAQRARAARSRDSVSA